MDIANLVLIFQATIDQHQHEEAEKHLEQIHKIIGFLPNVLRIIMEQKIELPVRQAAAIYLKNEIAAYWTEKETKSMGLAIYSIHEQDRAMIRDKIIEAIIFSPDAIRISLAVALNYIIKYDFPEKCSVIVQQMVLYLQTPEPSNWMGALISMLQLAKNYEYKNNVEKAPLLEAMKLIGPIIYKLMVNLLPDNSEQSVSLQKIILKIIFIITQYSLPLSLFTNDFFTQWMVIFRDVLDRPVPNEVNNVDVDERYELCWYKAKKWAIHILVRIFDRYGSPKTVQKEYKTFAPWYIKTFSSGIIGVILKILKQYSENVYLTPRILQQCINYLNHGAEHIETWKLLKPDMAFLVEKVVFPLMCYTDEDDQLWNSDPQEYIRRKFDFYEDYVSPVSAAQNFLNTCCKKRKDMLKNTVAFSVQVLSSESSSPRYKDGALHMLGVVSDLLLKKKIYMQQINDMLAHYVFPYFNCEQPFLRARAAWVLHYFEDYEFENELILSQVFNCLQNALLNDHELPVKVQAAISLHIYISSKEKVKLAVEGNLKAIIIQYLNIIQESENDDVTNALQKIIYVYGPKVISISVEIIEHLVNTLNQIISSNDDSEDKTITTMGILSAIDSVLMMIETKEVLEKVEPIALKGVFMIFHQNFVDLYEESFNIVASLTEKFISNDMWKLYEYLYQIMTKDSGVDYFTDMMSALHNFIVVDPDAFLAVPDRVKALFEMCKFVLSSDVIEDIHTNAVKIIECFILQFREKVENFIPSFVEIVLARLMKDIKTEELTTMCLQVLIVVFYINHDLLFQVLEKLQPMYPNKPLINFFFESWLQDFDSFLGLHDRKVCILGLTKLLSLEPNKRPLIINELSTNIVPDILKLFENLKEAYKAKANADADTEDDDSDIETEEDEEDVVDEEELDKGNITNVVDQLKQNLPFNVTEMDDDDYVDDDDDDDSEIEDYELTPLEDFETTIDKEDSFDDEYVLFRRTVELLKQQDGSWYNALFSNLNPQQLTILEEIFVLAQRRQDAAESRKIEQSGGYVFANQTIPTNFNFGGGFSLTQH